MHDLLTLARREELRIAHAPVRLDRMIEAVIHSVQVRSKAHQLNIKPLPNITLEEDRDLLHQLILILLDNALKYTPSGGEIQVEFKDLGIQVCLSVTDSSSGIAPDEQNRVSERFYHTSSAEGQSGSGLGLSIAQRIVRVHNGHILLDSEPGRGSTFAVILPRPESEANSGEAETN